MRRTTIAGGTPTPVHGVLYIRPGLDDAAGAPPPAGVLSIEDNQHVTIYSSSPNEGEASSPTEGEGKYCQLDGVVDLRQKEEFGVVSDTTAQELYGACGSNIPEQILSGHNVFLLGYGLPQSGRSSALWGTAASVSADVSLDDDSVSPSLGVSGEIGRRIFDGIQQKKQDAEFTAEVSFSLFETKGTQARDFLRTDTELSFDDVTVGHCGLTQLPSVAEVETRDVEDWKAIEASLVEALNERTIPSLDSTFFLVVEVTSTKVELNATTGEKVSAVYTARLTIADIAAAPSPTLSTRQQLEHPLHSFQKYLESVKTVQSQGKRLLPMPNDDMLVALLLAPAFGSSALTVCVGTVEVKTGFATAVGATVEFLSKVRTITNDLRSNGGVAKNVAADVNEEIQRLKKMIDASGESNNSTVTKLRKELAEKETVLHQLESLMERAFMKYEELEEKLVATEEKAEAAEQQRQHEAEAKTEAQFALSTEKQRSFATAFRNAFLVGKERRQSAALTTMAQSQVEEMASKLKALEIEHQGLREEHDRKLFEVAKKTQESDQLKSESIDLSSELRRSQKELEESRDEVEELSAKLKVKTFEDMKEVHDLRHELAAAEQKFDNRGFEIDELQNEVRDLRDQLGEHTVASQEATREKLASSRDDIQRLKNELKEKEQHLLEMKCSYDQQHHKAEAFEHKVQQQNAQLTDLKDQLKNVRVKEAERVGELKEQHAIEREGYASLIGEGITLMRELERVEQCFIQQPSYYRSGWAGVVAWLQAHGLSQHQSAFQAQGFVDMNTVAHITEQDLVEMKVLRGTRRKLLAEAEVVRQRLETMRREDRSVSKASQGQGGLAQEEEGDVAASAGGVKELLGEFGTWMRDFVACIKAEGEEAVKA